MNKEQVDLKLLPVQFKIVATAVLAISLLFAVLYKLEVFEMSEEISHTISKTGVLLSLLIFAMTRSKIEDELTLRIRLRAFAVSFIFGVGIVIVEPIVNVLFGESFLSDKGVIELLLSMFFFYFLTIFYMKRNR